MNAEREFVVYGTSHLIVLGVFVAGTVAVLVLGARLTEPGQRRFARVLAVVVLAVQLTIQVYSALPENWSIYHSLPFQLSDLAAYTCALALWTLREWAYWPMYYWGLTLSTQALVSPALRGDDFPDIGFIAFWTIHLLVIWAAIYLTWGMRMRPTWRGYRLTVAVTAVWAATMLVFNAIADTNYGFLNAKPAGSVLDLFGPWPWYLVPEFALILGVWALMTWPWTRSKDRASLRP
ncbi:putative integral membrane protein (TIGR02206 family) [Herbihabitans rhizosphaerae]|uniref:Putative integral membrane protein (TIGR02206 family) n=1 Tax=Herbihabitans rhizosphaerae TaxID=1872711 RepID=A0A4Q7L1P5_9PSEU|nr:TIGR02206 family membrane protein [Herbihabitans rhizosphaerae]RZS43439.1 putative integral membrane protein (TIGR02206 family) [Herbihabitans rhizosphaerae]